MVHRGTWPRRDRILEIASGLLAQAGKSSNDASSSANIQCLFFMFSHSGPSVQPTMRANSGAVTREAAKTSTNKKSYIGCPEKKRRLLRLP